MKKIIFSFCLLFVLCAALVIPTFASGSIPRLTDAAGLLTVEEAYQINANLDEISERLNFDVVIITLPTLDGADVEQYSWNLYDYYGFGYGPEYDGVLLLISMEERDWIITSTGFGEEALNADVRTLISNDIVPMLSAGNYYGAFNTYAARCDEYVSRAQNGEIYKAPFNAGKSGFLAVIVSFVTGLVATGGMKGNLKSVKSQYNASNYVKQNSLNVREARERYLYSSVAQIPRAQNTSARPSGGSSSHSSTSGKF